MPQGFVYILVSPNSSHIKIGGTERPISERLRGINATTSYADHGPWEISDFLHVTDWRIVERGLHFFFRKKHVKDIAGTNELFGVPPNEARKRLRLTDRLLCVGQEKTDAIFSNRDVKLFLYKLFQLAGLFGALDVQGAWTLSLLPKTSGGRWFTLNIGPHEVAFSTLKPTNGKVTHYLILDRLILDYPETIIWVGKHGGEVVEAHYASAERAVSVSFHENFSNAEKFFGLPGVRRALVAYWFDALADLRQRSAKSVFARYHSYDAVSQLLEYNRAAQRIVAGLR